MYRIDHDSVHYSINGDKAGTTVREVCRKLPPGVPRRLVATACSYAKKRATAPVTLHAGLMGWFIR
jgi:hypothetical protein